MYTVAYKVDILVKQQSYVRLNVKGDYKPTVSQFYLLFYPIPKQTSAGIQCTVLLD